jgi:NAD-dependent deacetylase
MKKILVFTGAGIDKESGIDTFRDNDGLWFKYKVEDVATKNGWIKDKEKVLNFYNERRKQLKDVYPNKAHEIIKDFENDYEVTVITQNVTNLHERAGSSNVLHLHGELIKVRSTIDPNLVYDWENDCNIGDKCEKGSQLRPHITWFNEDLDNNILYESKKAAEECDICIIVGTSLQVYPANEIPFYVKPETPIYVIDPGYVDLSFVDPIIKKNIIVLNMIASMGLEEIKNVI